jgi:16S rRNA U1498 N3-methylase RsmE
MSKGLVMSCHFLRHHSGLKLVIGVGDCCWTTTNMTLAAFSRSIDAGKASRRHQRKNVRQRSSRSNSFCVAMLVTTTAGLTGKRSWSWFEFATSLLQRRQHLLHSTTRCQLNRFLFDSSEVLSTPTVPTVILPKDDYRTVHAAKVLQLQNGDTVRAGIIHESLSTYNSCVRDLPASSINGEHRGCLTDVATIQWIPEGKIKKAAPTGNGQPPGSLRVELHELSTNVAGAKANRVGEDRPAVSLILALPRPLQLGRMLPMIAQLGVDHIVLTSAAKVPRDYFGSHLFRQPQHLRDLLIEGLCQNGMDTRLPTVHVLYNTNQLRDFLGSRGEQSLDSLFPLHTHARVIAHPRKCPAYVSLRGEKDDLEPSLRLNPVGVTTMDVFGTSREAPARRMKHVRFPNTDRRRVVVAVGPEGGWEEPAELELFLQAGFQPVTLGPRVLRSDVAVVSLLSLAHESCTTDSEGEW